MKRRFGINNVLKKRKKLNLFRFINKARLCFYIFPVDDTYDKDEFTKEDLQSITLLDDESIINSNLLENNVLDIEEGNIYTLFAEGVFNDRPTGADLDIYNYGFTKKNKQGITEIDYLAYLDNPVIGNLDELDSGKCEFTDNFWEDDDVSFEYCLLAQEDPLGGSETQIIQTFKGYLEVGRPFGIIRKWNADKLTISKAYIPEYFINKYQLRNGDEIICTCKESNGKLLAKSLLMINDESCFTWNPDRKFYNNLSFNFKPKKLIGKGDYIEAISTKIGLFQGDDVFIYINKNTQKAQMLTKFINELTLIFDNVIYINPQYNPAHSISSDINVLKFCASASDAFSTQIKMSLLGVNYAKRLTELGKNVAVLIDDINIIATLDSEYNGEMPTSKSVLNCAKATTKGSITAFTLVPLRSDAVNTFTIHDMFRSLETVGIVIDNNEIDLYNSYRV